MDKEKTPTPNVPPGAKYRGAVVEVRWRSDVALRWGNGQGSRLGFAASTGVLLA